MSQRSVIDLADREEYASEDVLRTELPLVVKVESHRIHERSKSRAECHSESSFEEVAASKGTGINVSQLSGTNIGNMCVADHVSWFFTLQSCGRLVCGYIIGINVRLLEFNGRN